jgi:hypothetical protein
LRLSRFTREPVPDRRGLNGRHAVKLESRKGPVGVLVIDGAQRTPIAN